MNDHATEHAPCRAPAETPVRFPKFLITTANGSFSDYVYLRTGRDHGMRIYAERLAELPVKLLAGLTLRPGEAVRAHEREAVDRSAPQRPDESNPVAFFADVLFGGTRNDTTTAPGLLRQAIAAIGDRAAERDQPDGEKSMPRAVAAFNAIHGTTLTEVQGWQFLELLKMVRAIGGRYRADDYIDGAAYAALAGEAAARTCPGEAQAEDRARPGEAKGEAGSL